MPRSGSGQICSVIFENSKRVCGPVVITGGLEYRPRPPGLTVVVFGACAAATAVVSTVTQPCYAHLERVACAPARKRAFFRTFYRSPVAETMLVLQINLVSFVVLCGRNAYFLDSDVCVLSLLLLFGASFELLQLQLKYTTLLTHHCSKIW